MTKKRLFSLLKIRVRPKGLHKSLTPDPWPLTPVLSTTVERALQIHPFLTNKANFPKSQVNLNIYEIMDYDKMDTWSSGKNKANSKPIQTQFKANSNPIQSQFKPKQSQFQDVILFDDYSFILYTGVLNKNKSNMEKQLMVTENTKKLDVTATFACLGTLSFWAFGPIFIKYLAGYIDSWTQNLLRYSAGCLFWLPFLLFAIKRKRIEPKIWRKALLPAVPNIIMQCFWAAGFYYIGPAFMVLLTKTSVIWVATFSFILFADERPLIKSKRFWFGLALSAIGVFGVMYYKDDFAATKTIIGIIIALACAFTWALYTVSVKIAFKDIDSHHSFAVISIYTVAGLFVLALLFGNVQESVTMGAWRWSCVVISGVTAISLGHVLYYVAIKRIGATLPALVILSQPFIVLAISNVVFGESLNAVQLIFGVVLLLGSALAIWAQQDLRRNGPDKT